MQPQPQPQPQPATSVDDVKVEWVELGEGLGGDYDPDDPDDVELLRFDVLVSETAARRCARPYEPSAEPGWVVVQDTSYCTRVPVSTPGDVRDRLLEHIHGEVAAALDGGSLKRTCEQLSWLSGEQPTS